MNIYSILLSKEKGDTFFPKLPQHRLPSEKKTKKIIKDHNTSIEDDKYRFTQQSLPKEQLPTFKKIEKEKTFRTTFIKRTHESKKELTQVGTYKIIKQIGKGGFAEVFEAQNENGQKFAIKQYNLQNAFECFRNEYILGERFFDKEGVKTKFSGNQGTENIIRYIQKLKIGKKGYIIQQYGGQSLSKLLSEIQGVFHKNERVYEVNFSDYYRGLAKNKNLAKLMKNLALGVKAINKEGYLHCDLKPQNILILPNQERSCKIIDFGSAFEREKGLPKITITPEYMPPELLNALDNDTLESSLSKVDVWSLGCTLLQILTGIPLWFRYKCKLVQKGRVCLQLGFFALTNREYHKIMRRQKELCQSIKKVQFTLSQFEPYRELLCMILKYNEYERANIDEILKKIQELL